MSPPKPCTGYTDRYNVLDRECRICQRLERTTDIKAINPAICIGPGIAQPLFQIKPQDEAAKAFQS